MPTLCMSFHSCNYFCRNEGGGQNDTTVPAPLQVGKGAATPVSGSDTTGSNVQANSVHLVLANHLPLFREEMAPVRYLFCRALPIGCLPNLWNSRLYHDIFHGITIVILGSPEMQEQKLILICQWYLFNFLFC